MIMKKITIIICAFSMIFSTFSCSDMLENDSQRQVFDPSLSEKTDSIYYALGILQGLQQLADQYMYQGEMRGDLVETTAYTDNNLRQLANFSATTDNKYDSAYVYYRVINNCNYYIAHRDTALRTGADYVAMNEYVAVKAIRAWTYMQLARVYGKVPFYTEPLVQISQIDDNHYPELDMRGIVDRLAPDLAQYSYNPAKGQNTIYQVPDFGGVTPGNAISRPDLLFMPVDVVLGDMYLETEQYAQAATHYVTYLTSVTDDNNSAYAETFLLRGRNAMEILERLPNDFDFRNSTSGFTGFRSSWSSIFTGYYDLITYIPFAPNSRSGATTSIPKSFGYDYYSTTPSYIQEVQIVPSQSYKALSDDGDYYYVSTESTSTNTIVKSVKIGDARFNGITKDGSDVKIDDDNTLWVTKNERARVIIYRTTTVFLHLAEAFNRMGMYDVAFAILKDGINNDLVVSSEEGGPSYISEESKLALTTTYPLLSTANRSKFESKEAHYGIHMHGAGATRDYTGVVYQPGLSPYQLDTIVGVKMKQIAEEYSVQIGTTKEDTINAVEDLLCDEYALEFAFEGSRFFDLCRLARHKNASSPYGANFGSLWLARKLDYKNPQKDLTNPQNWYLPFK